MAERRESIVDASVPNAGRIYDYMLGGHHNFEVDRQAAEQVLKFIPFASKMARLQRWCLHDIAQELTEVRGYDIVIDFASGLPTVDHLHTAVKPGTTVIYSDYDPVVVEYGREILGDTPNTYFFEADAREPEELLYHPEVQDILADRRDVALIYWGTSVFLSDEDLTHASHTLYEWSGDKSCWAFNAQLADTDPNHPITARVYKVYEDMGSPGYLRSLKRYLELLQPWQVDERGPVSLLTWHGFDESQMTEEDQDYFGAGGGGYGMFLFK